MTSHLVPEKRLDKNQRLVTKYVKPDVSGTRKPLSAPPSVAVDRRAALLSSALETLKPTGINTEAYRELYSSFSDDTLRMISENVAESGTGVWSNEMLPLLTMVSITERDIREYITFAPALEKESDVAAALHCVRGLRHTKGMEHYDDFTVGDKDFQSSVQTMIRLTAWGHNDEKEERYIHGTDIGAVFYDEKSETMLPCIHGDGLIDIILSQPDRGDDIIALIQERGYTNAEDLKSLLDYGVPSSLIEGVL